jgi:hypothetical protein
MSEDTVPRYYAEGMSAIDSDDAPLACNLSAIAATDRPRYSQLVGSLRAAIRASSDLADGFTYDLDESVISLPALAEWITMERLCCPFLTFQIDVKRTGDTQLTLRGPDGVKAILRDEFPVKPAA